MTHSNAFVTKTHWNNEELKALNRSQLLELAKQVDTLLLERGTPMTDIPTVKEAEDHFLRLAQTVDPLNPTGAPEIIFDHRGCNVIIFENGRVYITVQKTGKIYKFSVALPRMVEDNL